MGSFVTISHISPTFEHFQLYSFCLSTNSSSSPPSLLPNSFHSIFILKIDSSYKRKHNSFLSEFVLFCFIWWPPAPYTFSCTQNAVILTSHWLIFHCIHIPFSVWAENLGWSIIWLLWRVSWLLKSKQEWSGIYLVYWFEFIQAYTHEWPYFLSTSMLIFTMARLIDFLTKGLHPCQFLLVSLLC